MDDNSKVICKECGWDGTSEQTLKAPNPFGPGYQLQGCPSCQGVNCFATACDEPGCWEPATHVTNAQEGYRFTCREHIPERGNPHPTNQKKV